LHGADDVSAAADTFASYPPAMTTMTLSQADVTYVRANFFTLAELLAGRPERLDEIREAILGGELPRPAYVLPDGTELFAADWLELLDDAGGLERMRARFEQRYVAAGCDRGEVAPEWEAYLGGEYAVCLVHVTPENMVRKDRLAASLTELLDQPEPTSSEWCARLRRDVWAFDALVRQFSPDYDRNGRFPTAPSRDRLVTEARRRYPDVLLGSADG
jgi:hypothetical protein